MRRSRFAHSAMRASLVLALVSALALGTALPASASAPPSGTTATAAALDATAGTLTPALTLTTTTGTPLDSLTSAIVTPTLNLLLGSLWTTLGNLPSTLLTPILSALLGTSAKADTPLTSTTNTAMPSPCSSPNCYNAGSLNATAPVSGVNLLNLNAGLLQGWTQYDDIDSPRYIAATAISSNPSLGLLGMNLLSLGVITASVKCNAGNPGAVTATSTMTEVALLNGAISIRLLSGQPLQLKIGSSGSWIDVGSLTSPVDLLNTGGLSVTAQKGSAGVLQLVVHLGVTDLLNGLGLGSVAALLAPVVTANKTDLTVSIGAGQTSISQNVGQAWGLEVGADLATDLKVDLLGLAQADLAVPSGIGGSNRYGNLLDLRLGATTCNAGGILVPTYTWIPPELN